MGKLSLYLVLGFSSLFLMLGHNSNVISNRAVDNMVEYNTNTVAYNIAVSGANMAANEIFMDNKWNIGYDDISFLDGTMNTTVEVVDPVRDIKKIISKGDYRGVTKTIEVTLQPSKFSKFAYYSNDEGGNIWWTSEDTVWGPFHTQDYLRVSGTPVFYGKVSTKKSIKYYSNSKVDKPKFLGGYEQGVNLALPSDGLDVLQADATDDGLVFQGKDPKGNDTLYLTFNGDSLKYRYKYNSKDTSIYLPNASPNGVIFAEKMTVRMKGVVKGQYTVGCTKYSGSKGGNIYLDDNIVLYHNPLEYTNAIDIFGIVAQQNVYITDNAANRNDINIDASIFCENGGFGAENYDKRPFSGNINLLGGIIQNERLPVGTFSKSGTQTGFNKRYKYDIRLLQMYPPSFPNTGEYEIVSWYE